MKINLILVEIRGDIPGFSGNYYEGAAAISASLKANGHKVSFTHLTRPVSKKDFIESLRRDRPDMLAFSSMTNGFYYVKEMASWCKEVVDIPIVCGGIHATLAPEEVISVDAIDMVCVGEGEDAIVEVCAGLEKGEDIGGVRNIWIKRGSKVIRNPVRPTVEDLDHYPHPDRDIFDFENLISTKENFATFIAGRGCPFNCAYCANHALKERYPNKGGYIRFKSVDKIIDEIQGVLKRFPRIKYVAFSDDILPLRIEWLREFSGKYREKVGLPFICNIHPSLVKDETIALLKEAGCSMVELGIESGNERIRRSVLNRRITDRQIIKAAELIKANGMHLATYNMVGVPGESMREIRDTIVLNGRINPRKIYSFIFYPYPGTKLYEVCKADGLLTDSRFDTYAEGTILKSKFISEKEVVFAHRFFKIFIRLYSTFGALPRPLAKVFTKVLDLLILGRLPYGFLIKLHSIVYKVAASLYMNVGRHIYNRQRAYYS